MQAALEKAVLALTGEASEVIGAGRTDAGVHAHGQVAHFEINKSMPIRNILLGMNFHLIGESVSVIEVSEVDKDFHARFSAIKRHYKYVIVNRQARLCLDSQRAWHVPKELDIEKMQEATKILIGRHDFTSFRSIMCQSSSPIKTLDSLSVSQDEQDDDKIIIKTSARSFLHNQVRIMVGALKTVGEGKWSVSDLRDALDAKDRSKSAITAPAHGLYFMKVEYPS